MKTAAWNSFGSTALTLSLCSALTRAISASTSYQSISPPCNLFLMVSLTLSPLPSIHLRPARCSARSCYPSSRIAKRPLQSSGKQEQIPFRSGGADRNAQCCEVTLACQRILTKRFAPTGTISVAQKSARGRTLRKRWSTLYFKSPVCDVCIFNLIQSERNHLLCLSFVFILVYCCSIMLMTAPLLLRFAPGLVMLNLHHPWQSLC